MEWGSYLFLPHGVAGENKMKFEPCLALRVPGFPVVFIISIRLFEIWPLGFESSLSDLLIPLSAVW